MRIVARRQQRVRLVHQSRHQSARLFGRVSIRTGEGNPSRRALLGHRRCRRAAVEYSLAGKWLELLKQIAPGTTRAAVLRDPTITSGIGQFAVIQSVAQSVGVEVSAINPRDAGEIERAIRTFANAPNGGLIVAASALATLHRRPILGLAGRAKASPGLYPALLRTHS